MPDGPLPVSYMYTSKSGNCALKCASYAFTEYISQCETAFFALYAQYQSEYGVINNIVTELLKINLSVVCAKFPIKLFL